MARRGHEVHLITMHPGTGPFHEGVIQHLLRIPPPLGYYLNWPAARNVVHRIAPHILNAHFASGYGTLSRLIDFHPTLLSVWGSDVYDFPARSPRNEKILRKNLAAADRIASTSHTMRMQTEKFVRPGAPITVTPFGVELDRFFPRHVRRPGVITIGTVKKLHPKYGIRFLIEAFARILRKGVSGQRLELVLAGKGPQEEELKKLAAKLGVDRWCRFPGFIPHSEVPKVLNTFDIFCAPSVLESESFGVAVVEASACGLPVVVSRIGGLPEVTLDRETGILVPPADPDAIAHALQELIEDPVLRERLGEAGRRFVQSRFNWKDNADTMEKLYIDIRDQSAQSRLSPS
jgi:glycosyltransferase involved in cell wall biosynthesis